MTRTRRVTKGPWLVLKIKGEFRGDNPLSEKRINLKVLAFVSKFLSFQELTDKRIHILVE
jgi:hypothetical protein